MEKGAGWLKRGNVWLGAAGLVMDSSGRWLVVKKSYGGLKGQWSLPAGFVDQGETADEAAVREVKEETGIDCEVCGVVGIRSGVIKEEISDNLIIFLLTLKEDGQPIIIEEKELIDAAWLSTEELKNDAHTSILLGTLVDHIESASLFCQEGVDPGIQFGYTSYKLFF
ncbi:NUDIX hydrolase [Bacillus sp. REN10]|uniref:NUDIX domain-containing protein n=1 Tax=Bacillus sp. REN10 TaxID=2782541 RepID=UPI00193C10A0|nr:NUDIX hydrolase [Bacillus sp. REN10]